MKKIFALALITALMFILCSCGMETETTNYGKALITIDGETQWCDIVYKGDGYIEVVDQYGDHWYGTPDDIIER